MSAALNQSKSEEVAEPVQELHPFPVNISLVMLVTARPLPAAATNSSVAFTRCRHQSALSWRL